MGTPLNHRDVPLTQSIASLEDYLDLSYSTLEQL